MTGGNVPGGAGLGLEGGTDPLRVLVVEGHNGLARDLEEAAADRGWAVVGVRGGRQALRQLDGEFYDVVVVGLPLPAVAPEAFFAAVVEMGIKQAQRLIFVVDDLAEPPIRKFLTAAARPFLTRPLDTDELLDLIVRVASGAPQSD